MPIYEYQCEICNKRCEILQKLSDPPLSECPDCQGSVRRLISSAGLRFKGSGWYVNDYAKKDRKPSSESKEEPKTKKKEESSPVKAKNSSKSSSA